MKQDIAERWIEALRSGEFSQAQGTLKEVDRDTKSYCCLGVLCHLAASDGIVKEGYSDFTWTSDNGLINHEDAVLPRVVTNWADMVDDSGQLDFLDEDDDVFDRSLADLNDDGRSFAEIADIIEEHWEHL